MLNCHIKIAHHNMFRGGSGFGDDEIVPDKLNIDELYDAKQKRDIIKLNVYRKVLGRAQKAIKDEAKNRNTQNCCWFQVPYSLFGCPAYDQAACIAFVIDKLKENQFRIKFYVPDILFISWAHLFPKYVRDEYKAKTGITINEFGEIVQPDEDEDDSGMMDIVAVQQPISSGTLSEPKKVFKSISSYKPTGKL